MARLSCVKCWALLPAYPAGDGASTCVACGTAWQVHPFPALLEAPGILHQDQLELADGLASCFHHVTKRAETSCSRCGKFLCALCTLEMGSAIWCAACLSAGAAAKNVHVLESRRILWDSIALAIAVLPVTVLFAIYFLIFTAPAAIFVSFKFWKRPGSLLPRTKSRFVVAIGLGLAELAVWFFMAYAVFRAVTQVKG